MFEPTFEPAIRGSDKDASTLLVRDSDNRFEPTFEHCYNDFPKDLLAMADQTRVRGARL